MFPNDGTESLLTYALFAERVLWTESDLDIFVAQHFSMSLRSLIVSEGYELEVSTHREEDGYPDTVDIEVR
jgi:hypothetical protein